MEEVRRLDGRGFVLEAAGVAGVEEFGVTAAEAVAEGLDAATAAAAVEVRLEDDPRRSTAAARLSRLLALASCFASKGSGGSDAKSYLPRLTVKVDGLSSE